MFTENDSQIEIIKNLISNPKKSLLGFHERVGVVMWSETSEAEEDDWINEIKNSQILMILKTN